MATEILGANLRVAGWACAGQLPPAGLAAFLARLVALIGMDTAGMAPQIWAYPLPDGRGGLGETICQPLVESFVVADTWPGLAHKGIPVPKIYIVLASCRPFDLAAVAAYLGRELGPVLRQGYFEL
jgi:hypothetical protein